MAGTVEETAPPKLWPQLPCGIKNGIFGRAGSLAFVGLGSSGTALYKLDLANPAAGWAECAHHPGPATDGGTAAVAGGRLFVFSGTGKEHPDAASPIVLSDVHAYDIAADRWQKVPTQAPVGLLGASAIALDDDRIAIFGGYNKDVFNTFVRHAEKIDKLKEPERWQALVDGFMNREIAAYRWNTKVLIYSISSNTWSHAGENPHPPNAGAALVAGVGAGSLMLIGGEVKPGLRTDRVQSIQFQDGRAIWAQCPPLPPHTEGVLAEGLAGAYAGYVGQTLIVAGGTFFCGARAAYSAGRHYAHKGLTKGWRDEIFALRNGLWHRIGRLPLGLAYGASFTTDTGLLVVGGEDGAGRSSAAVFEITPDRGVLGR